MSMRIQLLVLQVSCTQFYFVVVDPMFRFLRWDPSVLLALSHMLLMWFVQRRSDVMRQPRYFASKTINSVNVVSATGARGMELPTGARGMELPTF